MDSEIRYVAATGALGVVVHVESLEQSLEIEPAFIVADAGTTDAGPFSLGMGVPAFAREAVKRDLGALLSVTHQAKIPALIGSAGTAGGDPHVDWVLDIAREIVREQRITLRTAVIRSEQSKDYLLRLFREGRIRALDPAPPLSERTIERSERIVGMMGIVATPHEVGIVVEATAATQELASKAVQLARQPFLHHGVPEWMGGITSFACLHNPAHIDRGPVYRFNLNHVAVPHSKTEMFRTEMIQLGE